MKMLKVEFLLLHGGIAMTNIVEFFAAVFSADFSKYFFTAGMLYFRRNKTIWSR